jgi:hypothetical protein
MGLRPVHTRFNFWFLPGTAILAENTRRLNDLGMRGEICRQYLLTT